MTIIDRTQIKIPVINFSERALQELNLIIENDFTLAGKYFRLLVSGKGCDGFTYSAGFTDMTEDDFLIEINNCDHNHPLFIIVDPFAAFYLSEVEVEFIQDPINELEGFVINNIHQKEFHGKFWREDMSKAPPLKENQKDTQTIF